MLTGKSTCWAQHLRNGGYSPALGSQTQSIGHVKNGRLLSTGSAALKATAAADLGKEEVGRTPSDDDDTTHQQSTASIEDSGDASQETTENPILPNEFNEDNTKTNSKGQRGAGIWTSLRSRLQATVNKGVTKDATTKSYEDDIDLHGIGEPIEPIDPLNDDALAKKGAPAKTRRTRSKAAAPLDVKTVRPQRLRLRPVEDNASSRVPKLAHNLDRVLFNPGVYHLQDNRSRVFNFDPHLASIMPVDEFDFDALKSYTTSSKDVKLRDLCAAHGMKYCGSTSSMTSILSHFHFLLSAWRRPSFENLSRSLAPESLNFTALSRGPAAAYARFNNGVYAIDSDKEFDTESVLSLLGRSMEKLLTLPKEEFEKYRRTQSHQITEEERNADEGYHYTTMGDFMMRSQLDAHDPRLPGSGMFDLKTRAVVSIRMDVKGYEKGMGYEIRRRFGQWESFEREYYDMIRAAFLKYSLQVRMGRMDGIFVAFHNTQRIFGFQYISISEMDEAIHGTSDRRLGDQEFKASLALLNDLLNRATQRFPGRSLRLHVETRPTKVPLTYFFVEPVTDKEMKEDQDASNSSAEQLEREIRDLTEEQSESDPIRAEENPQGEHDVSEDSERLTDDVSMDQDAQSDAFWKGMMAKVDETVENEALGVGSVREAVQAALEQTGLLRDKTELETEQHLDALVTALTAHSAQIRALRQRSSDADDNLTSSVADSSASESPTVGNASLRDLILKVTEGIDDKAQNLKAFERMVADLAAQSKHAEAELREPKPSGSVAKEEATSKEDEEIAAADAASDDVSSSDAESGHPQREVMGMYVTIRNRVNGEFVERPTGHEKDLDWAIQYAITELPDKRAQRIYSTIRKRRKTVLAQDPSTRAADWYKMFKGRLPIITKKGEKYREKRTQQEAGKSVYVAWDMDPLLPGTTGPPVTKGANEGE